MQSQRAAITRFTSREDPLSDMVALLTELDSQPLVGLLALPTSDIVMRRELTLGTKKSGRIDMVVCSGSDGTKLAILEAKIADTIRNGQLEKYEDWAADQERQQDRPIKRYLVDLNAILDRPLPTWEVLDQRDLLGAWSASTNEHCRWLSNLLVKSLDEVNTQAEDVIGNATAWPVHDVVTRRMHKDIADELEQNAVDDWNVHAGRDNGGNPMLTVRLRHPIRREAWLLLDLRSPGRDKPIRPWDLRLGMRTFESEFSSKDEAGRECFAAAMESLDMLSLSCVEILLDDSRASRYSAALISASDGFKKKGVSAAGIRNTLLGGPDRTFDECVNIPTNTGKYLYQDGNLQLGAKYELDVSNLTRHHIKDIMLELLRALHAKIAANQVTKSI